MLWCFGFTNRAPVLSARFMFEQLDYVAKWIFKDNLPSAGLHYAAKSCASPRHAFLTARRGHPYQFRAVDLHGSGLTPALPAPDWLEFVKSWSMFRLHPDGWINWRLRRALGSVDPSTIVLHGMPAEMKTSMGSIIMSILFSGTRNALRCRVSFKPWFLSAPSAKTATAYVANRTICSPG
jgi:hypothetical protein